MTNAKEFYGADLYNRCTMPAQRKVEGAVKRLDDAVSWLDKAISFGAEDDPANKTRVEMSLKAALKAEREGLESAGVSYA